MYLWEQPRAAEQRRHRHHRHLPLPALLLTTPFMSLHFYAMPFAFHGFQLILMRIKQGRN